MKHLHKILFAAIAIVLLSSGLTYAQEQRDGLTWYNDVNKAGAVSNATHKPIFGFFTGSDWCVWCHRMEENVFSKAAFKEWAKKNVVLLELDFPRNKKLPDNITQQNAGLQQAFQVRGYPTVWLFNISKDKTTGKQALAALGSLGYPPSATPGKEEEAFLETANGILKKKS